MGSLQILTISQLCQQLPHTYIGWYQCIQLGVNKSELVVETTSFSTFKFLHMTCSTNQIFHCWASVNTSHMFPCMLWRRAAAWWRVHSYVSYIIWVILRRLSQEVYMWGFKLSQSLFSTQKNRLPPHTHTTTTAQWDTISSDCYASEFKTHCHFSFFNPMSLNVPLTSLTCFPMAAPVLYVSFPWWITLDYYSVRLSGGGYFPWGKTDRRQEVEGVSVCTYSTLPSLWVCMHTYLTDIHSASHLLYRLTQEHVKAPERSA